MNVARKNALLITACRAMCVALGGMSAVTPALAQEADTEKPIAGNTASLGDEARTDLERGLTEVVRDWINRQKRTNPQAIAVNVVLGGKGDDVLVMIGSGYIADDYDEIEDGMHEITELIRIHARKVLEVYEVSFLFDGRDVFEYFPEDAGPPRQPVSEHLGFEIQSGGYQPRLLVSAGHGIYWKTGDKAWATQRSLSNGIVEDYATPAFARDLDRYLVERSGAKVFRARSTKNDLHADSKKRWYEMAARYWLKELLPDFPEVWNSKPGVGGNIEHQKQDIRSRPFYANYLGADALIHLHTNASDKDPEARGIRVYYYTGRLADQKLASLALCYMQESLKTNEAFSNFPVAPKPHPQNHGENRLAAMPSIVAELGFHTNKEDAAAIGSYVFRDLTMRGLEKAYRMFREGRGCEPFTVQHPEVNLVSDMPFKANLVFGGAPRFPVKYEMAVAECTPGIICTPRYGRFNDPASPLTIDYGCTATKDHPFTIKWDASFIDADGIAAKAPVTMTCKPKASRRA